MSAMSTWMSCSALPAARGSLGIQLEHHMEMLEALVMLEKK